MLSFTFINIYSHVSDSGPEGPFLLCKMMTIDKVFLLFIKSIANVSSNLSNQIGM